MVLWCYSNEAGLLAYADDNIRSLPGKPVAYIIYPAITAAGPPKI